MPRRKEGDTAAARRLFRGIAWVFVAATVVVMGFTLGDEIDGEVRSRSGSRRSTVRTITRASQPVNFRVTMVQHWLGALVPAALGFIILRKTRVPRDRGAGSS
jgi:hypothetical protein